MLDLSLFRRPAMNGVSLVAFTIAASIFAMFLYLTLYIQDDLGYGPLAAGLRFLPITVLAFAVAPLAGRLTVRVPSRALLGTGMLLVAAGCALMTLVSADSAWTVLLPGFIVAGIGIGTVNPVLASSAIAVVPPERSGMASGANNTFRQVGIATGIALLGALFANRLASAVGALAARTPFAAHSAAIAAALRDGGAARLFAATPPQQRGLLAGIVRGSFTAALNEILLVAAVISFASGVLSFVLIRTKDFVSAAQPDRAAVPSGQPAQGQHQPAAVAGPEPGHPEQP